MMRTLLVYELHETVHVRVVLAGGEMDPNLKWDFPLSIREHHEQRVAFILDYLFEEEGVDPKVDCLYLAPAMRPRVGWERIHITNHAETFGMKVNPKSFTGTSRAAFIGTRKLSPKHPQYALYMECVEWAVGLGYVVTTGAALGADQVAAKRAVDLGGRVELYLPWPSYEKGFVGGLPREQVTVSRYNPKWESSVDKYHPAPERLSQGARKLHARNYGIVEQAAFVVGIPETPGSGGTGQGLRIGKGLFKPCFDLTVKDDRYALERFRRGVTDL